MIKNTIKDLYKAPSHLRWALANYDLIGSACIQGSSQSFGPRGRVVRRLIGIASFVGANRWLVASIAYLESLLTLRSHRGIPAPLPQSCRIFVGFGAGPEEDIWRAFSEEQSAPKIRLDETRPESFLAYYRPRFRGWWRRTWREAGAVVAFLQQTKL